MDDGHKQQTIGDRILSIFKKKFIYKLTPTQFIVLGYATAVIIATVLLMLPISHKPGMKLSFLDALFTAVSGVSVTGLTTVNTAETFSIFGTIVLMFTFQIGGIGIMALGTFLWLILGRNISLTYRRLIMIDQNRHHLSGLVQLIRLLFFMAFLFEIVGAIFFSIYFYVAGYFTTWPQAIYYGTFHAISSYTNAGFDLFGDSLARFSDDYYVQAVTMLLIMLGAIGFPVLLEIREYIVQRKRSFRFSLYTKLTTTTFLLLILLGAIGILLMESNHYLADKTWHEKLFFALFNSITTRSGGLSTMDVSELSVSAQYFMSILMFIGASPSSVGGGIRTTTLAVVMLALFTYAKGKFEVRAFHRTVKEEDVKKSLVVFSVGSMLTVTSILLLDWIEQQSFSLTAVIFEVSSAFGTCGLSNGITEHLSDGGKILVMLLMFIGRIGILSLLFIFRTNNKKENYHYPKEDLIIGQ